MERITSTVSDTPNQDTSTDSEYSGEPASQSGISSGNTEYPPLSELLLNHLSGCESCQITLRQNPVGLGQTSSHCSEYKDIIRRWSEREGKINNIVAQDEYGNKAPTVGDPRKDNQRWRLG